MKLEKLNFSLLTKLVRKSDGISRRKTTGEGVSWNRAEAFWAGRGKEKRLALSTGLRLKVSEMTWTRQISFLF